MTTGDISFGLCLGINCSRCRVRFIVRVRCQLNKRRESCNIVYTGLRACMYVCNINLCNLCSYMKHHACVVLCITTLVYDILVWKTVHCIRERLRLLKHSKLDKHTPWCYAITNIDIQWFFEVTMRSIYQTVNIMLLERVNVKTIGFWCACGTCVLGQY